MVAITTPSLAAISKPKAVASLVIAALSSKNFIDTFSTCSACAIFRPCSTRYLPRPCFWKASATSTRMRAFFVSGTFAMRIVPTILPSAIATSGTWRKKSGWHSGIMRLCATRSSSGTASDMYAFTVSSPSDASNCFISVSSSGRTGRTAHSTPLAALKADTYWCG